MKRLGWSPKGKVGETQQKKKEFLEIGCLGCLGVSGQDSHKPNVLLSPQP